MRRILLGAIVAAVIAAPAAAQVTVSSGPPTNEISPVGEDSDFPGIPTALAQTFQTVSGFNYLQTFTFFLRDGFGNGSALQLKASVYEFDTDHLGALEYASDFFFGSDAVTQQPMTIGTSEHPLNVFLSVGQTYALVVSSVEGYATTADHSTVAIGTADDVYPGGALFYTTVTDPADLFTAGAFADAGGIDAAGSATFTADRVVGTPEPSTTALFATGLLGLGITVKRRRRNAA